MIIIDFLHKIKARVDELAILGALMDIKDVTDIVFAGLGDDYKEFARDIQARESFISFEELDEKLLTFKINTSKNEPSHFLAITNLATKQNNTNSCNQTNYQNQITNNTGNYENNRANSNRNNMISRPYLGYCQICGV